MSELGRTSEPCGVVRGPAFMEYSHGQRDRAACTQMTHTRGAPGSPVRNWGLVGKMAGISSGAGGEVGGAPQREDWAVRRGRKKGAPSASPTPVWAKGIQKHGCDLSHTRFYLAPFIDYK